VSVATGIGSHPGDEQRDFDEAVRVVLGEVPDLPYVPEVPGCGVAAGMIGRTLGLVTDLGVDLQPAGWRLTGYGGPPGIDHRRAQSLLAQDLDTWEEQTQAYGGRYKTQIAGPWTLAATVERPRGDKILADHGGRRELAQALAEGVGAHVADLRRRVPGAATLIVQIDEPALPAVQAAAVPTASGFGRHRKVEPAEASQALEWVFAAIRAAGAEPWVHCCAADVPIDLLCGAGAAGILVDASLLTAAAIDRSAEALEAGVVLGLGQDGAGRAGADGQIAESVLRWLDMLGLDPTEVGERLVLTPDCGLAGASPDGAKRALGNLREAARHLGE
jgi:methionine synthase II (cobalamin-independent)